MRKLLKKLIIMFLLILPFVSYAKIKVVAAENFYANVAELIGGNYVEATSIINNPNADPHSSSTSPSTAIAILDANVIIYNGAGYDTWMNKLLAAQNVKQAPEVINVAKLLGIKMGANPHIWYKPDAFSILAKELTKRFSQLEPQHQKTFELNLKTFLKRYHSLDVQIADLKARFKGTNVTATEPVFGYMAQALGLNMLDAEFQQKIMNDATPSPKMFAHFQDLLKQHQVKILFYNKQVTDNVTNNILKLAKSTNTPVVGVLETMPKGMNVITWLKSVLKDAEKALEQATQNTTISAKS